MLNEPIPGATPLKPDVTPPAVQNNVPNQPPESASHPIHPKELNRNEIIDKIIQTDQAAYDAWLQNPSHRNRLDMPKEALRYLLISKRVLELADDPEKIDLLIIDQKETSVETFILEHKKMPVTNKENLDSYMQSLTRPKTDIDGFPIIPRMPEDVDYFHTIYYRLVQSGKFGLNDYVTSEIILEVKKNNQLFVELDWERENMTRQGLGTSFYSRLKSAVLKMGTRFITGKNAIYNSVFFINKLGRFPLSRIKPEFKTLFYPDPDDINQDEFTVDFLRPEDKEIYLEKSGQ